MTTTNYEKQAQDFLKKTETTLEIKEATTQTPPKWATGEKDAHKHIQYTCTLKNKHHTYTFNFWGSIHDYEIINAIKNYSKGKFEYLFTPEDYYMQNILKSEGIAFRKVSHTKGYREEILAKYTPTAYDVLACLSPLYEDTFEDFCASFDYDVDSRKAYNIYQEVLAQDNNLRRLFNRDELDMLANIN